MIKISIPKGVTPFVLEVPLKCALSLQEYNYDLTGILKPPFKVGDIFYYMGYPCKVV